MAVAAVPTSLIIASSFDGCTTVLCYLCDAFYSYSPECPIFFISCLIRAQVLIPVFRSGLSSSRENPCHLCSDVKGPHIANRLLHPKAYNEQPSPFKEQSLSHPMALGSSQSDLKSKLKRTKNPPCS